MSVVETESTEGVKVNWDLFKGMFRLDNDIPKILGLKLDCLETKEDSVVQHQGGWLMRFGVAKAVHLSKVYAYEQVARDQLRGYRFVEFLSWGYQPNINYSQFFSEWNGVDPVVKSEARVISNHRMADEGVCVGHCPWLLHKPRVDQTPRVWCARVFFKDREVFGLPTTEKYDAENEALYWYLVVAWTRFAASLPSPFDDVGHDGVEGTRILRVNTPFLGNFTKEKVVLRDRGGKDCGYRMSGGFAQIEICTVLGEDWNSSVYRKAEVPVLPGIIFQNTEGKDRLRKVFDVFQDIRRFPRIQATTKEVKEVIAVLSVKLAKKYSGVVKRLTSPYLYLFVNRSLAKEYFRDNDELMLALHIHYDDPQFVADFIDLVGK